MEKVDTTKVRLTLTTKASEFLDQLAPNSRLRGVLVTELILERWQRENEEPNADDEYAHHGTLERIEAKIDKLLMEQQKQQKQ